MVLLTGDDNLKNEQREFVRREATLLQELAHPYIVRCKDFFPCEDYVIFVVELCKSNTLDDLLKARRKDNTPFTEEEAIEITTKICLAVYNIHQHEILHGDIRPTNIFMGGLTPKLADFGLVKSIKCAKEHGKSMDSEAFNF